MKILRGIKIHQQKVKNLSGTKIAFLREGTSSCQSNFKPWFSCAEKKLLFHGINAQRQKVRTHRGIKIAFLREEGGTARRDGRSLRDYGISACNRMRADFFVPHSPSVSLTRSSSLPEGASCQFDFKSWIFRTAEMLLLSAEDLGWRYLNPRGSYSSTCMRNFPIQADVTVKHKTVAKLL